jgi:hypothetical protein
MQVEPQITFKGLETSPAFEALIRQRIDGLEQMHPHMIRCRVVVEAPHRGSETAKVPLRVAVEVDVLGRPTLVAKDAQERHEALDPRCGPVLPKRSPGDWRRAAPRHPERPLPHP